VEIGGMAVKVFLFVATLGYSRRLHVRAYGHEKQDRWFDGMESAFRAFGGVPREVLLDNAKALILHHDPASREVVLHPRLHAFASHWRLRIRACTPYRARTKGKDERGVGYVESNAIAGRRFASWSELEAHLQAWTREVPRGGHPGCLPHLPRITHTFRPIGSRSGRADSGSTQAETAPVSECKAASTMWPMA
jgi:transposase